MFTVVNVVGNVGPLRDRRDEDPLAVCRGDHRGGEELHAALLVPRPQDSVHLERLDEGRLNRETWNVPSGQRSAGVGASATIASVVIINPETEAAC